MIEQTRFLSTVFLCHEFVLENIYSGLNFCGKNICGNFYLRELIFADGRKNRKNRINYNCKNFVPRGIDQLILEERLVDSMSIACVFTVFMTLKTFFKILSKRPHRSCLNFAITEATKGG